MDEPSRPADLTIGAAPAERPPRAARKGRSTGFNVGAQEFIQTGLDRFDLHDPYYFALSLTWRAFLLLFLVSELTINTVFALFYLAEPGCIANARPGAFTDAFFFSLETLATVGYGVMAPATTYGHLVSGTEIVSGMAFTAIMTGLLFVRFSRPKARIVYAACPVVSVYNGTPTLMLRIGNGRASVLTNVTVTMHVLVQQMSAEGHRQRSILELPLVRSHLPLFAILWTLMHVIDETSPLAGFGADDPATAGLRLFVTVSGRDQAMGQEVSDIQTFSGADIRFAMRYVDAVRTDSDNRTFADYGRIGAIEPDG